MSKGCAARVKGHSFEREAAISFREFYPKARRHLEYQDGQCFGVDLAEIGPFKVQCKKLKAYASINTINEVKCDRELGDIPLLMTAGDSKPAIIALYADDFFSLLRSLPKEFLEP